MSDESNSSAKNENLSVGSNDKRVGGEYGDSGSVTKKPRTDAFEEAEKEEEKASEASKEGNERNSQLCDQNGPSVNEVGFEIEAEVAEDKGSRHTMEDAWVVLPDASLEFPGKLRCAHYAIYDGHGGRLAAEYAQKHLHEDVLSAGLPRELLDVKAAKRAILDGFRRTDETLIQESAAGGWQEGATAVCVWVLGQTVFVANIGDAKAVVARSSAADGLQNTLDGGTPLKAIVLTREHKAIYPQERARIQKAGGSVSSNGRVLGRLEVSRAFGDRQFKKVGVIATPDIHSFDLTERDHFIILGCDGLWGVFGPSDAVEFVHKLLKEGLPVAALELRSFMLLSGVVTWWWWWWWCLFASSAVWKKYRYKLLSW
ncbi:hypothetical protein Vadar_023648 [Vaccinium darrowii]|uniref:Uncharacterized protein n=1 Tax=Vaccinium darrowii TaxID=229202 RepID=A0ACB7YFF2_9ERIC|nr:hypothetical protein Vadar_023648 [Vaccinium darrowii]